VSNYKIDPKGNCLLMWEYWHFGKYHRQGDGEGFKTQPWKTLNVNMLENTNTQKGNINNL